MDNTISLNAVHEFYLPKPFNYLRSKNDKYYCVDIGELDETEFKAMRKAYIQQLDEHWKKRKKGLQHHRGQ